MTDAIPGNLLTTAMAVMPHTDVACALDRALSLDVPLWPQRYDVSHYSRLLPGQPGQGTHGGASLRRREPDGGHTEGEILTARTLPPRLSRGG